MKCITGLLFEEEERRGVAFKYRHVLFFSLLKMAKLENYLISNRRCLPEPLNLIDITTYFIEQQTQL